MVEALEWPSLVEHPPSYAHLCIGGLTPLQLEAWSISVRGVDIHTPYVVHMVPKESQIETVHGINHYKLGRIPVWQA